MTAPKVNSVAAVCGWSNDKGADGTLASGRFASDE
jgi:hypothetical protein